MLPTACAVAQALPAGVGTSLSVEQTDRQIKQYMDLKDMEKKLPDEKEDGRRGNAQKRGPQDFQWVSNGFPMDFERAFNLFPLGFKWIPYWFEWIPHGF